MAVALVELAVGVDEPGVDEPLKAGSLLVGEAVLSPVRFGVGQVVLGVGYVEIPAEATGLVLSSS
ncbi:MAG: hypothetical protein M9938_04830 [Solirubrobacterales bacterium]|nr:hypothetical protein [Solirubrobacterales bacterium]